jgi:mono/diheme cytochrome c family protein
MRSHVDVVEPGAFAAFMKKGATPGGGSPALATFQTNCGGCHTFKPAGTTGKVGPDLDNLAADATKAGRGALDAYVRESIVDPGAYIAPGYSDAMPHIFDSQLSKDQLDQLVQYLSKGAAQ